MVIYPSRNLFGLVNCMLVINYISLIKLLTNLLINKIFKQGTIQQTRIGFPSGNITIIKKIKKGVLKSVINEMFTEGTYSAEQDMIPYRKTFNY